MFEQFRIQKILNAYYCFAFLETDNGSYEFSSWKTASLQFQSVVPMQTWRIVFSGGLRLEKYLVLRHVTL